MNNSMIVPVFKIIDVSKKSETLRKACVFGSIFIGRYLVDLIEKKSLPKGDPLVLSEIACINAAKNVSNFVLLCHNLSLDNVSLYTFINKNELSIDFYCIVSATSKTGVEMEAMAGISAALLTVYDMVKGIDPSIYIKDIRLLYKEGGIGGIYGNIDNLPISVKEKIFYVPVDFSGISVVLITISDRAFEKIYDDISGKNMYVFLKSRNANIIDKIIIPDSKIEISKCVDNIIKKYSPDLILTTGGTGLSDRDVTFESLSKKCKKFIFGIGELLRLNGSKFSKTSWLSNSFGGIIKNTLIISLPGKPSAVIESVAVLENLLIHALKTIKK